MARKHWEAAMAKIALIVGHKKQRPGSCNQRDGVCEWGVMNELVEDILFSYSGKHDLRKVLRVTYDTLPYSVNKAGFDMAISFHANGGPPKATGSETIYCKHKPLSLEFAQIMHEQIVDAMCLRDRGIITPYNGRGSHILCETDMPCILIEPFFITNDDDLDKFFDVRFDLIWNICEGIEEASHAIKIP